MPQKNSFMFWIACLVSLGGILFGYDIGVISGALLFIKNTIPMTDTQMGMMVGAVLAGSLVGTLVAGTLGDRFGRRALIMASSVIFILGVCLVLLAQTFLTILCARLLLGVGAGVVAVAVPLYVAEMVPANIRGRYMTFFQLLLTFGIVMAYVVDLIFTPSANWRAMFAVVLVPAFILFVGMFFLPETPRFLIAHHKLDEAEKILQRIRFSPNIKHDIQLIQNSLHQSHGTWAELFSKQTLFPLFVALSIAIFNQLTGINSFLQYAPLILKNAGIQSNLISMLGSAGIGTLNFICTMGVISMIDTLGRRPLLLVGVLGVVLSECFLGAISFMGFTGTTAGVLSLVGLFAFIVSFAIGPGVVVWLAISELFPTRVRGKGIALCLFFNSLASTLLATFFLVMIKKLGMSETYFLFAFFSLGYFLIVFYCLPETKTKSLEEIQFQFQRKPLLNVTNIDG